MDLFGNKPDILDYTEEEIRKAIQVDYLIYHNLDTITDHLKSMNPDIQGVETSMFSL